MSQDCAATTIQKYARRWIVEATWNSLWTDTDQESLTIEYSGYTYEWDEESLVRETYGRATHNFSGGTTMGPLYQAREDQTWMMDGSDDETDWDYP